MPFTWASGDTIRMNFKVPTVGRSSQSQTSEDFGGRDVVLNLEGNSAQAIPHNTQTKLTTWNVIEDTSASWDSVSSRFIVPESGYYDVTAACRFNVDADADVNSSSILIYKNGSILYSAEDGSVTGGTQSGREFPNIAVAAIKLNKGDYLELFAFQNNGDGDTNTVTSSSFSANS